MKVLQLEASFGHRELGFGNRPFLSSLEPLFQTESVQSLCIENEFSFIWKAELIIITKCLYFEQDRGSGELGNGLLSIDTT